MTDERFGGWAVAAAALRWSITGYELAIRPFTVATFHREDAERYARHEMERDRPPADGWEISVSAMPVRFVTIGQ